MKGTYEAENANCGMEAFKDISVRNVSFAYSEGKNVLDNIDFTFEHGKNMRLSAEVVQANRHS